jgi:hypothetical protein
MAIEMMTAIIAAIAILCAGASTAAAQGIAVSYQELRLLVQPGDRVTVIDHSGRKTSGRITELSATSLALMVDGQRTDWAEGEVATITQRRGDSLANGAWIGLGVGAGFSAVGIAISAADDAYDDVGAGEVAAVIAIYAGIGAGIGAGIDALISRHRVIFERKAGAGVSLAITPQFGPARAGARLSIRF